MTKKENIFFTALILLLSLVPLLWFHGNQILIGYDNVFPINTRAFLLDRLFSWTSTAPFGADQSGIQGSLIIHLIDTIPGLIGFGAQASQKIVYVFWFFLILSSSYLLIVRLEKAKLIKASYLRYIFPVLYAFNFYMLQAWWITERTKFSLVVATPLILSIILPMIKARLSFSKILKNSILCALILTFLNGGGWIGLSLYGGLILILVVFYFFFLINSIKNIKNVIFMTMFYLLFGLFFLFLNAYTFLPFLSVTFKDYGAIVNSAGGVSGLVEWASYLSENTSVINLLRLQGIPDWYNNINHPFAQYYLNNIFLIFASFLFAFLIVISFLEKKLENKQVVSFFLLLFLISFIFTAGIHKPMGFIPEFLIRHLPGFGTFRSLIFKFGYAYWLAASFLIGISLSRQIESLVERIKHDAAIVRSGVLIIVIALILVYHFPYFSGDIFRVDKTGFSSRVTIPSYAYDFSSWWLKEGSNNRVLLLPKLNKNWLFEQYKWGYLSLFPVLGNFANRGIIENNDTLSSNETEVLNKLYNAIIKQNYEETDSITSLLGIKYFLIRKDFYYNFPNQTTDNPYTIEEKLLADKNIIKVKSFGPWEVYQYKSKKPYVFAKSNGIFSASGSERLLEIEKNPLALDVNAYLRENKMFSDSVIFPECISCEAEKQDIQVEFPKPKILLDSSLYDFVQFMNKLKIPKNESVNQKISRLLGESLSMSSQVHELLIRGGDEYYVNEARGKLEDILDEISNEYEDVTTQALNPYSISIIIEQYLMSEARMIDEIRQITEKKNNLINLEKILYILYSVGDKYRNFYESKDINVKKIYKFNLPSGGDYFVKVDKASIGELLDSDYKNIKISLDNNRTSVGGILGKEYLDFGNINLDKGEHNLTITLSPQQNLLTKPVYEKMAGKKCYSSYVNNFSSDKIYELKFTSKNNFDHNFLYFVDDGKKFSPYSVYYFPLDGEQIKSNRIVVSVEQLPLNTESNMFRISFCAPSLTENLYKNNIQDLSTVELSSPKIILHKKENNVFGKDPMVDFEEVDQTHYKVSVKNAEKPYYLVFAQRFSPNWISSLGEHFIGNNYNNVWFIRKTGDYSIDLKYEPQKYFIAGAIISILTLAFSLIFLFFLKDDKRTN